MSGQSEARRVPIDRLERFIERTFVAVGMPAGDARTVASLMAAADALGAEGHGIFRLPQYVKRIRAGGLNLHPDIRIARERAGMALLDGDNAMGHLVMHRAAELATRKAAEAGVAWVGARHSNHAGPASLYARIPLRRDMIGLYVAVGNANHLPPWGGTEMLLSTNPVAIAVPAAARPPLVLDMATTVAAYGKVKTEAQRGETMPEGWMLDREGRPLTDPKRADQGFLLPIGGYKGYGLGLMFGILAGILNGAAFGRDTIDFNADFTTPTNTGHFVVAIDVGAFLDLDAFKRQIDAVWDTMKSSPLLPGVAEIRLPGERTHRLERDNCPRRADPRRSRSGARRPRRRPRDRAAVSTCSEGRGGLHRAPPSQSSGGTRHALANPCLQRRAGGRSPRDGPAQASGRSVNEMLTFVLHGFF